MKLRKLIKEVKKHTEKGKLAKRKKKITKKMDKVNWHQIIALSAAGQYISEQLREELKKLPITTKRK